MEYGTGIEYIFWFKYQFQPVNYFISNVLF
jgi:hypothetical protein